MIAEPQTEQMFSSDYWEMKVKKGGHKSMDLQTYINTPLFKCLGFKKINTCIQQGRINYDN